MKPQNPILGLNQEPVCNILTSFFDRYGYDKGKYNNNFCPVTLNGKPNVASISLINLEIKELNLSDGTVTLVGECVREYKDTRLQYDAPDGILYVQPQLDWSDRIWGPNLQIGNPTKASAYEESGNIGPSGTSAKAFIGPSGDVYMKSRVKFTANPLNFLEAKLSGVDFKFIIQLQEQKHEIQNLVLKWKEENPVQITTSTIEFEYKDMGHAYKIDPVKVNEDTITEKFGNFGEQKFSRLSFEFSMKSVKDLGTSKPKN